MNTRVLLLVMYQFHQNSLKFMTNLLLLITLFSQLYFSKTTNLTLSNSTKTSSIVKFEANKNDVTSSTYSETPSSIIPSKTSTKDEIRTLYMDCHIMDIVSFSAFEQSLKGFREYHPAKPIITIVDFSLPSSVERFFVIDLAKKKLLFSSLVAHGQKSGDNIANSFSNKMESHQSSLGFYMVGSQIISPKHGAALLLNGLQKGINDNARSREIIIHGAAYVSASFVHKFGRLGRSYGCPALPIALMPQVVPVLANGSLLYIHS
jgi:L,D-transpeptidase catalytic domain